MVQSLVGERKRERLIKWGRPRDTGGHRGEIRFNLMYFAV
jgi:hypothetical protein